MFINICLSPFLSFLFSRLSIKTESSKALSLISLTVLLVALGNCFKPLITLFSVPRLLSWIKCQLEKRKGEDSKLNQVEANTLFEPMDFPIEIYYSLVHTSLMMTFFYLGCFQILIIIELPALVLVYFIAKWMLLRVCKKPQGLSLQLNNLAQSLLRFFVPLYWLGRNLIFYFSLPED